LQFYIGRRFVTADCSIDPIALYTLEQILNYGRPVEWGRPLYFCLVVSSFYLFFLAYSQPLQIGCLPYFHTWCGLSANLGCRSETCWTPLTENTGRKKIAKNSLSAHHRTTLLGSIFAPKAQLNRQSEKKLLNSIISSTCPHNMVNFGPQRLRSVRSFGAPHLMSSGFASW